MRKILLSLALVTLTAPAFAQGYSFRSLGDIENLGNVGRAMRSYDRSLSRLGIHRQGRQDLPGRMNNTSGQIRNLNKRFNHGAYSNSIRYEDIPNIVTDVQQIGRSLGLNAFLR